MRLLAPSTAVLACVALAACAHRAEPDLRLPAAYEAHQPANAPAVDLDRWWTTFNDPQLTALIDSALVANPDAKTATARLREARATRVSQLSSYLPQGNPSGSATRTDTDQIEGGLPAGLEIPGLSFGGVSKSYSGDLNVSWEIDLFGRLFAAKRATDADVAAAEFDYYGVRASLAAQVADAYFQARGLAIQLADAQETVRIRRQLYDLASRRAERGLAPTSEPDRVAGDLAQAESQALSLEGELKVQRRLLLILAGRASETTTSVDVPAFVGAAPAVPASLPSDMLRRRPDVLAAEADLAGAFGRQDLARLAFLPTFTLRPGYGWSRQEQPGSISESKSWSIGVGATQPLFDIPNLIAQNKIYNARAEQAAAAYEKTVQTAFSEAEAALVRLDADRRRVGVLTDGEARAERAYKAAYLGYTLGLNDLETTLSSEQAWRQTRVQLTSAQVQSVRDAVQAFKAVGGGWPVGAPAPVPAPKAVAARTQ